MRTRGVGMAMTSREPGGDATRCGEVRGMRAREVACYVKSWNAAEAALGLATINSVLNAPDLLLTEPALPSSPDARPTHFGLPCDVRRPLTEPGLPSSTKSTENVFELMKYEVRGKRVAVVGHFRGLDELAATCALTILERFPQKGDLPDAACEYVLHEQDYVFITGTTLINKTLPRLLQLSRGATVAVVGPSTPMTPVLFDHGVQILAGTTVLDEARVWGLVKGGDQHGFFDAGARMLRRFAPGVEARLNLGAAGRGESVTDRRG